MTEISDTELLHALMEDDAKKAPGLKGVAEHIPVMSMEIPLRVVSLKASGKTIPLPKGFSWPQVANCEPSHTVGEGDDTKISCPGCQNLMDPSVCWCGSPREQHFNGWHSDHGFIPMGCDCHRGYHVFPPPTPPPPPEPEVEHEWDIL